MRNEQWRSERRENVIKFTGEYLPEKQKLFEI